MGAATKQRKYSVTPLLGKSGMAERIRRNHATTNKNGGVTEIAMKKVRYKPP
jgi:hypothetical protein